MNGTFPSYAALPGFGFLNRGGFGLDFKHPQCELSAVEGYRPWPPGDIVSFAGHFMHHGEEFGFLEFELPATVESMEQLKAMLAYQLRYAITSNVPEWILEGISLLYLVPQVQKEVAILAEHAAWQTVYAARDRCAVRRKWLKLALKDLADALKNLGPAEMITLTFDGSLLSIDCGRRIMVQAKGSAWPETHRVQADKLVELPKRLMRDPTEVAIFGGRLTIGNCGYRLADLEGGGDAVAQSADNP